MEKKTIKVKSSIKNEDLNNFLKYTDNLVPNEFFDEIEKIDHCIQVPGEYAEMLKGHICMCGKLIVSSLLPKEIKKEYEEYIERKNENEVISGMMDGLGGEIRNEMLKDIMDIGIKNKEE